MAKNCGGCSDSGENESFPATMESITPTVDESLSSSQTTCGCHKNHTHCTCNNCSRCRNSCSGNVNYASSGIAVPPRPDVVCNKDAFARIDKGFNYPAVGYTATVTITNVVLAEGQPISNPNFGTLIVNSATFSNCGEYELINLAASDNPLTLVGKHVPCDTEFYLGVPSSTEESETATSGCNHLIADFHVPVIGGISPATVQSFVGFEIGKKVIIRNRVTPTTAYTYLLSDLSGTNSLLLQNTGQGGVPFDVLFADNPADGEFDWCVEPYSSQSLCEQSTPSVCITALIGCDQDGNLVKLAGANQNEAPVYDSTCGGYTNRILPSTTLCVSLDTCFQVTHLADTCDRQNVIVQTGDDQGFLEAALDVLLSTNAEPQVTICDYPFTLLLSLSSVGNIVLLPTFNPDETVFFGCENVCQICIPADCCAQCDPAVKYPIEAYFPPGHDQATSFAIPTSLLQVAGEYKFSVVKSQDNATNILLLHDNVTDAVTHAYNGDTGAEIALGSLPGDTNEYYYERLDYCHNEPCPVDGQHETDMLLRFVNTEAGTNIATNFHTDLAVYPCDNLGVPGQELSSSQHSILGNFIGPSVESAVAIGEDPWGTTAPAGGIKPYDAISGYNKRTFALFYNTCMRVTSILRILIKITTLPTNGDFIYGAMETTSMFRVGKI